MNQELQDYLDQQKALLELIMIALSEGVESKHIYAGLVALKEGMLSFHRKSTNHTQADRIC